MALSDIEGALKLNFADLLFATIDLEEDVDDINDGEAILQLFNTKKALFINTLQEKYGMIFKDISGDGWYCSLEIIKAANDCRLSDETQEFIYNSGFLRVYLNHMDGYETVYDFSIPFTPVKGWRTYEISISQTIYLMLRSWWRRKW